MLELLTRQHEELTQEASALRMRLEQRERESALLQKELQQVTLEREGIHGDMLVWRQNATDLERQRADLQHRCEAAEHLKCEADRRFGEIAQRCGDTEKRCEEVRQRREEALRIVEAGYQDAEKRCRETEQNAWQRAREAEQQRARAEQQRQDAETRAADAEGRAQRAERSVAELVLKVQNWEREWRAQAEARVRDAEQHRVETNLRCEHEAFLARLNLQTLARDQQHLRTHVRRAQSPPALPYEPARRAASPFLAEAQQLLPQANGRLRHAMSAPAARDRWDASSLFPASEVMLSSLADDHTKMQVDMLNRSMRDLELRDQSLRDLDLHLSASATPPGWLQV